MQKTVSRFKVYIEGQFAGVVEAACHDHATAFIYANWMVGGFQRVEVIRFATTSRGHRPE